MSSGVKTKKEFKFIHALIPIIALVAIIVYGLIIQPQFISDGETLPLEMIFIGASAVSIMLLFYLGYSWSEIQDSMVLKLKSGLPAIFVLFCIGLVIGSWIISGTIPMLIYQGIKIIDPKVIYLVAFVVPGIFSILTGTSWGSTGTIGVVIIGIAALIDANLAITAGAIVGGAYFGDKMSPLSDTTNIAALSAEVDLYEHIRSMMNTTVPAAILAAIAYTVLGFVYAPSVIEIAADPQITETLTALESIYNFNILLLVPPAIVLYGAVAKKPTVPVLVTSSAVACLIGATMQNFAIADIFQTMNKGFNVEMITWVENVPENLVTLLSRGGLYQLIDAITVCMIVFVFIGTLDVTDSLKIVVDRSTGFIRKRSQTILATLFSTALCNSLTSNQFATSFIIGGAFKSKFDDMKIPRKVLSRCIEDAGTMWESMIPWSTTGIFMATTLGIPVLEYAPWQLLTIFNLIVACILAITGKGCFYHEVDNTDNKRGEKTV